MKTLTDFITTHRDRFEITQNNIFAFSWSKVTRRLAFLDLIGNRYLESSRAFINNSDAARQLVKPGTHPVTPEQASLHEVGIALSTEVHLQIESYYLFAKIMLDDTARALEHYFGPARGLPLDSHDGLAKNLKNYGAAKNFSVPPELLATIIDLKHRISDVRDYKISHEKSPCTMAGTMWDHATGLTRITMTRLYPRDKDPEQFETESLPTLRQAVHDYLDILIAFVISNEGKTALTLEKRAKDQPSET